MMQAAELFHSLHPGFFEQAGIRALPSDRVFTELTLSLKDWEAPAVSCPESVTFAMAPDDLPAIQAAVAQVDTDWVQYFSDPGRVFCGLEGEKIISFCILDEMGSHGGLRVAGPGCVGTLPACRGRGVGLAMVREATLLLKKRGCDLSYIHYTHLEAWYARLGYETILRWSRNGILWTKDGAC